MHYNTSAPQETLQHISYLVCYIMRHYSLLSLFSPPSFLLKKVSRWGASVSNRSSTPGQCFSPCALSFSAIAGMRRCARISRVNLREEVRQLLTEEDRFTFLRCARPRRQLGAGETGKNGETDVPKGNSRPGPPPGRCPGK